MNCDFCIKHVCRLWQCRRVLVRELINVQSNLCTQTKHREDITVVFVGKLRVVFVSKPNSKHIDISSNELKYSDCTLLTCGFSIVLIVTKDTFQLSRIGARYVQDDALGGNLVKPGRQPWRTVMFGMIRNELRCSVSTSQYVSYNRETHRNISTGAPSAHDLDYT